MRLKVWGVQGRVCSMHDRTEMSKKFGHESRKGPLCRFV